MAIAPMVPAATHLNADGGETLLAGLVDPVRLNEQKGGQSLLGLWY